MTGIMMEAFILEAVILILGMNIPGYLLGGALSLLSALLHKGINLLILYGTDIVRIYVNFFDFFKSQLKLEHVEAAALFYWIIILYIAAGALSALTGFIIGKSALKKNSNTILKATSQSSSPVRWDAVQPDRRFQLTLLFFHTIAIPAMLITLNTFGLTWYTVSLMIIYIVLCTIHYKRILSRLSKPLLWIQFVMVTLLAGIFWDPSEQFTGHFNNGFIVGIEMILRAVFIIAAFSGLSVELRNPVIKTLIYRIGFEKVYVALSLAFNSLPAILECTSSLKNFFRNPVRSVSSLLVDADQWYNSFKTKVEQEIYLHSK